MMATGAGWWRVNRQRHSATLAPGHPCVCREQMSWGRLTDLLQGGGEGVMPMASMSGRRSAVASAVVDEAARHGEEHGCGWWPRR